MHINSFDLPAKTLCQTSTEDIPCIKRGLGPTYFSAQSLSCLGLLSIFLPKLQSRTGHFIPRLIFSHNHMLVLDSFLISVTKFQSPQMAEGLYNNFPFST